MPPQSYTPYRGYIVEIRINAAPTLSFHGLGSRYRVSWAISSPGRLDANIGRFSERLVFVSEVEALRYAENRVHTFIDCVLSQTADHFANDDVSDCLTGSIG